MKKTVLTFGLISGAIISALMLATVPFVHKIGMSWGMAIGYTTMVLAFLLVFFGIRSYRENVCGGWISFRRALGVGLLIMLISCACYVVTWEFIYFTLMPDFGEKYAAYLLENARTSGASPAELAKQSEEIEKFRERYSHVLFNSAITFLEPLPVGLIMTLISARLLRRNRKDLQDEQDEVKEKPVNQEIL